MDDPRMRLGIAGFVKYLRKSPPDDTDIAEALTWVRDVAERVLGWEPVTDAESVTIMDTDTGDSPRTYPVPGPDATQMDQLDLQDELAAQEVEDQFTMTLDPSEIVEATA